ncbi:hypothetical protein NDU88_003471 [Pleurodeles waltl]|uniref:Uncharacterized protein n=1 Tax=Pleurodeles waltl TaxID=8319 RepID=A0AAV7W672_PLEWA|nr:hypothetical protein NDU88_003471 [Pleurodeles waltl]
MSDAGVRLPVKSSSRRALALTPLRHDLIAASWTHALKPAGRGGGPVNTCRERQWGCSPAGRWPASGVTKPYGKNTGRTAKDGKIATDIPPPDSRGKDKIQPVITCFLTGGMQESVFKSSLSPPKDTPVCTKKNCKSIREETAHAKESKEMSYGSNSPLIRLQGAEGWLTEAQDNVDEQRAPNGEEDKVTNSGSVQSQPVEPNGVTQATQDVADTPTSICSGDPTGGMYVVKNLEVEARKIGRRKKVPDWSKDGGDKFYSLTKDSEATSSGCNQSAREGSTSSQSSAAESTVRQQRQQRRCLKARAGLTGGDELSGQSTKALKWYYLGTRLTGLGKVPTSDSLPNADERADCQVPCISATSTDSEMSQIIYDSIKALQTAIRAESQRARIATKRLQGAVCKVAKS